MSLPATLQTPPYPAWADEYLGHLRTTKLEATAAQRVGQPLREIRNLRSQNVEFDYAVEEALEQIGDYYEEAARRRAVDGIDKGVYYEGERVDTEKVYSDGLLTSFLKAKRRREFGDKQEITGSGGAPIAVVIRQFTTLDVAPPTPLPIDVTPTHLPQADALTVKTNSFTQARDTVTDPLPDPLDLW